MATRLHQVLAVAKTEKSERYNRFTKIYQLLSKPVFSGFTKTFQPTNEDIPETRPDEVQRVQYNVEDLLLQATETLTKLFDQTATIDRTNQGANADVVVNGTVLLERVPTVTLLFLEKQLADLYSFVKAIPTLDPAKDWHASTQTNIWETDPVETISTKKISRPLVLYPHSDKHPAQVKEITDDVQVGKWLTKSFSGAVKATRMRQLRDRVETLQAAVKYAREHANTVEVVDTKIGKPIFDYLFSA